MLNSKEGNTRYGERQECVKFTARHHFQGRHRPGGGPGKPVGRVIYRHVISGTTITNNAGP